MAQSGYTPIKLYSSTTPSATPTAGNLEQGELAINTNDGKLFYEDSSGVVQVLATKDTAAGSFTTLTDSGNLNFTGTGNRITGDFSNATIANRVAIQTSTTNGNTAFFYLPNGTSQTANAQFHNASDPTNAANMLVGVTSSDATLRSGITGTGTYLPMTFYTGGSERVRVDTSGNVGIGTASPINNANQTSLTLNASQVPRFDLFVGGSLKSTLQHDSVNGFLALKAIAAEPIVFFTNNTERMRIDSSGNVGIGTSTPAGFAGRNLVIQNTGASSVATLLGDYSSTSGGSSIISTFESLGSRFDGNQTFGGRHAAAFRRCDGTAITSNTSLGYYAFGGQWGTDTSYQVSKVLYAASIVGVAEGSFTSATAMPTGISFRTGSTGEAINSANITYGTERMRLDSSGNLGLGVTPSAWTGGFKVLEMSNGSISINSNGPYINQNAVYESAWKYKATGFASQYQQIAGQHQWATAPSGTAGNAISFTQAMTLDASGRLGIGATSLSAKLQVDTGSDGVAFMAQATSSTGSQVNIGIGVLTANRPFVGTNTNSNAFEVGTRAAADMIFVASATERARITSGGQFFVGGATALGGFGNENVTEFMYQGVGGYCAINSAGANAPLYISLSSSASGTSLIQFSDTGVSVGNISTNGTTTTYGTTSDYRLKENVAPMTGALAKIAALKPCTFSWKSTGQVDEGFIAHELQAVFPSAVAGEKDAVYEDGRIKPQSVDTSFLVATVVAALQELKAEFDAYKAAHP